MRNLIYIPAGSDKPVREFIRLALAWMFALASLALYQQFALYREGVLDDIFSRNLALLMFHHIGFVALVSLAILPIFKFLEKRSSRIAIGFAFVFMTLSLVLEFYLQAYFLENYEPLVTPYFYTETQLFLATTQAWWLLPGVVLAGFSLVFYYQLTARTYRFIGRLYPVTLILLGLALMSHKTEKKPVNENKIQWLVSWQISRSLETIAYEGSLEFPLMKSYREEGGLSEYMALQDSMPHVVLIVIDGLGKDLVGPKAPYAAFAPFLNSLDEQSLVWENHLSNAANTAAAMTSLVGSLPFGKEGFHELRHGVHRQTLFAMLGKNGYRTGFHYGGNLALMRMDYFMEAERVDRITDRQNFSAAYQPQAPDRAGISLGYPDHALYQQWMEQDSNGILPEFSVFLNLSTRDPYAIPDKEKHLQEVQNLLDGVAGDLPRRKVKNNMEYFASVLYADHSLQAFMERFSQKSGYGNTIFLITGSYANKALKTEGLLQPYQVPFLLYAPMLSKPQRFTHLSSHADVMPSIIGLLDHHYLLELPEMVSWMGHDLTQKRTGKEVTLFRAPGQIDYLVGNKLLSSGQLYSLDDELNSVYRDNSDKDEFRERLKNFRAINQYVTREDKLIPPAYAGYALPDAPLSREEMVWVNSVFNGRDFDKAFQTARSLAFDGELYRAKVLCRYILSRVPVHTDTHILLGRIHAWEGDYQQAIRILENTISKYPHYADAYAALLDVYYWAGRLQDSEFLAGRIRERGIEDPEIELRIVRLAKALGSNSNLSVKISG